LRMITLIKNIRSINMKHMSQQEAIQENPFTAFIRTILEFVQYLNDQYILQEEEEAKKQLEEYPGEQEA
jgi:hypothetical protein